MVPFDKPVLSPPKKVDAARLSQRHHALYDEAAARLAWQRTVDFFNKQLRS
jgi:dienelactone hydrolase